MRKLVCICLAVILGASLISCKKEEKPTKKEIKVNVQAIDMPESFQMYVKTEEGFIPVTLDPKEADMKKHVTVSCEPDDVVSFSIGTEGISIKPMMSTLSPTISNWQKEKLTSSRQSWSTRLAQ